MPRSFLRHLISMACILLSVSAVSVQDSQAYRNMDMTRERISLIFELSAIFLSFQMVLSLANYTHLYSKSGSIFSDCCHISPVTITNYLLYISMFSRIDLVISNNMFSLILTILLLYFVIKTTYIYIYIQLKYILNCQRVALHECHLAKSRLPVTPSSVKITIITIYI